MGISLLAQLDELSWDSSPGEFDTAFFLTYSLSLHFFEQLVLPRLTRMGVVRIGVLADERGYQASLDDPLASEQCGRAYVLGTCARLTNLQHGKMLWLHGDRDLAYVGSHNLTMAGFNDQLEITACLDSVDSSHRHAMLGLHRAITAITRDTGYLQKVWSMIPEPHEADVEPTAYFLWSGEGGLLDQVAGIVGNVVQLRVVTPFLDSGVLASLRAKVGAEQVTLDLPYEGADTPLADAVAEIPSLVPRRVPPGKRLHAKAYSFASTEDHWLALGSANCTLAGLAKGIHDGGNVEFLLLLPGGLLPDDEMELERVEDAADLPGTGRRWDEEKAGSRLIRISTAECCNGELTVTWESTSRLDEVTLLCGRERYEVTESPIWIRLETVPSVVILEARARGQVAEARAWVSFVDDLDAQVSQRRTRRWREYMESDDPEQYASGIDAYFVQLLRDLVAMEADSRRPQVVGRGPSERDVQDAIEVFAFSSEPKQIASAAGVLVSGDLAMDPLGALRGLVTRLRGVPPTSIEEYEESLAKYEKRRSRAQRRMADLLLSHLRTLVGSTVDWASTPSRQTMLCLRGTFEATVLLWRDVIPDDPRDWMQEELLRSFTRLLAKCAKFEETLSACRDIGVAGPLLLATGIAAEAAGESDEYGRLRSVAVAVVSDPQTVFNRWLEQHGDRARLLVAQTRGTGNLQSLLRPALLLYGQIDPLVRSRQEHRWGLLLRLYDAECAGEESVSHLYEEAEKQYGTDEVWQTYKRTRPASDMPRLRRVRRPVCEACYVQLPAHHKRRLERGDAVICPNCSAILFWDSQ